MAPRRRRHRKSSSGSGMAIEMSDKNERFLKACCCTYLERLNERFGPSLFIGMKTGLTSNFGTPSFQTNAVQMAFSLIGTVPDTVIETFNGWLPSQKRRGFAEKLEEAADTDDMAEAFTRYARHLRPSDVKAFVRLIGQTLSEHRRSLGYRGQSDIEKKANAIQDLLRFNTLERDFFVFLLVLDYLEAAENFFVDSLQCQVVYKRDVLAAILGVKRFEADGLFTGKLAQMEIFEANKSRLCIADDYLRLFENPSAKNLSEKLFAKMSGPLIDLDRFFIPQDQVDHLKGLLRHGHRSPTHVLFYGPAGTGKTSFARSLCDDLGMVAYDILHSTENRSQMRRAAIQACRNMLENDKKGLIVIDEADNLLNTNKGFGWFGETQDKGWLNRLMERQGPPIIWITNDINGIAPSVRRRFAFSLGFKPFGRKQRRHIWESVLQQHKAQERLPETMVSDLVTRYAVAAGPIDMAVRKAVEVRAKSGQPFCQSVERGLQAFQRLANGGHQPPIPQHADKAYTLKGLTIDGDLQALIRDLEDFAAAKRFPGQETTGINLLFYGPPGTGKSETARFIADHLDRTLIVKNASELLNCYVGETEKNIRDAFEQASAEEAVLVLDEADSFLFARQHAVHSWEISFTNEFLAQMERFSGILICTSNRFADMDEASVRRFAAKLRFDFLRPEGSLHFYQRLLAPLTSETLDPALEQRIMAMQNLAPGDYKTVVSRFRFRPKGSLTHEALIEALEVESKVKRTQAGGKAIGFGQQV